MKWIARIEGAIAPGLLVIACVGLLQRHAIPYWQERMGQVEGVITSITLEAVALLLLWRAHWTARSAGFLIGMVLVGVPVYQITAPAVAEYMRMEEQRALALAERSKTLGRMALIQADLEQARASLSQFEANSAARLGWAGRIDLERGRVIALSTAAHALSDELATYRVPPAYPWHQAFAEGAPVTLAMIAFYFAGVWGVLTVAGYRRGKEGCTTRWKHLWKHTR